MLTRERFARMLDPYIYKVYEVTIEKGEDYADKLFSVGTSKLAEEHVSGIGAADLPQPWAKTGQVYYSDVDPLWDKTFRHEKYSLGLKFERELWDDAQHAEVKNRVNAAMLSIHRFRQINAHALFNNAFNDDYKIPDGQALCAAAHPASPDNSATQSNVGNLPLTIDNLEETRVAMFNFKDDKGKEMLIVPDTLIVPPALEMLAKEIVLSSGRADTADNADNVRKGAYDILTLPLLSDGDNWFLVDSKLMKQYNLWFDRRRPTPERVEDFDTEVIKYKMVERFSFGSLSWQWCYGHNVS